MSSWDDIVVVRESSHAGHAGPHAATLTISAFRAHMATSKRKNPLAPIMVLAKMEYNVFEQGISTKENIRLYFVIVLSQ